MYETALELLASRDADIQADKQIFRLLSVENISVSETWKHLIRIKNGSIRFDACKEFLEHQLGSGNLQQTGDVRIMYSSDEIHISLPGEKAPEQKIFVTFTDICRVFILVSEKIYQVQETSS